ncbi:MAG: carboxypeptidase regulatory-like domain-containing protein [Bryobacteraceae bacterium]|nr:carboxypeptidase regulatory-like domain-containing protein [Bryobacteraceae bacterium]
MTLAIFRIMVVSALITAAAVGQTASINAELTGIVLDPTGAPIANATVRAANAGTGYQQITATTSSGMYRLPVLPLGRYSLVVEAPGFARYEQSGIALSAGSTATVDVKLQLKGVTTEVLVSSSAPIVDAARTDQGSTLSSNAVLNLPLVSRNPFNFILQQPNVSGRANTEFGVPRKVNANGFNGRINYQLDGSNNVQSAAPEFACSQSPKPGYRKCRR